MTDQVETIYPSDYFKARDLAISKNPKDKNGYGAFRIVGKASMPNAGGTFYPFEVYLDDTRKWKPVSVKFTNLTHVGKILPLEDRAKNTVQDIAVLFKGDYTYERLVDDLTPDGSVQKGPDGKPKKKKIIEEYGKSKDFICNAFMAHVRKHMDKGEMFTKDKPITPNVKHEQKKKDSNGKITYEKVEPANINVGLKFTDSSTESKKRKDTKFKALILDASRPTERVKDTDWPFEVAKSRFIRKNDDGSSTEVVEDLNNGNIHHFLRGGSILSGFDRMGSVCINATVSLPSSLEVVIVKKAAPQSHTASAFDADEFASIAGAKADEPKPSSTMLSSDAAAELGNATSSVVEDEFGDIGTAKDDLSLPAPDQDDF